MRNFKYRNTGNINVNYCYDAIPLEVELEKILIEKAPIIAMSPIIFTERKDGVRPEYDIRTDKWEIAHEAMSKVSQVELTKFKGASKKPEGGDSTSGGNMRPDGTNNTVPSSN